MGSCIICGASVDGRICDTHQEDVVFEFRGNSPEQLTPGRFYRGTVDGFAEFGVFVDVGDSVTGLLHRSELDNRLESLDWDAGDTVFVQVQNVRDNGNVDLGWSIRQSEREFRGTLIDDPDRGHSVLKEDVEADDGDETVESEPGGTSESESDRSDASGDETVEGDEPTTADEPATSDADSGTGQPSAATGEPATADASADAGGGTSTSAGGSTAAAGASGAVVETPDRVEIGSLSEYVGERVRLEGVVEDVHQTSGPTVFTLRDETDSVECAAFEEAGVRAYPEVVEGDVARFEGEVEKRRGDLQLETEALVVLEDDEREAVEDRLDEAMDAAARPDEVEPLVDDETVVALSDDLADAATAIRRAVFEDRPIVVRHAATADGYVGAVALERATLPLIRDEHAAADAVYHYFDRRPLEAGVYDMADATGDVTTMLDNRERHGEKLPLFVFVAAGGTRDSLDGFELLDVYGAERVVVDDVAVDEAVADAVGTLVTPDADAVTDTTATVLAANVAAHVNADVREDLLHLPAVSYWDSVPAVYADAAIEAGYDETSTSEIREAVALEAYYQSYEDKRELIIDLVFDDDQAGDGPGGLAENVSEQFRTKLSRAVDTAEANLTVRTVEGTELAVLDTDAFTHRFEFPPTNLLLDELYRRHRDEVAAVVGADESELHVRPAESLDLHAIVEDVRAEVPEAGLTAGSAHEGIVEYLAGERDAVLEAVLAAVAERV